MPDTPELANPLQKLRGHTPQAVLEDRSLYSPAEPEYPELAEDFWRDIEKHGESTLAHSVSSTLYHRSFFRDAIEHRFPGNNQADLANVITLDTFEWYLHNFPPPEFYDKRAAGHFNSIAGMVGGVIDYQLPKQSSNDEHNLRVACSNQLFVIPEGYDGRVRDLFHGLGGFGCMGKVTVIGDVSDDFACYVDQGMEVELFGNALDDVASNASRVNRANAKRPKVVIHGNVGKYAGRSASSLILEIEGNAGDFLGARAGYSPSFHDTPEHRTSVLVRIEGMTGSGVGDDAHGEISISAGFIGELGNVSKITSGTIHEGFYRPGTKDFKQYPGRLLAKDGKVLKPSGQSIFN